MKVHTWCAALLVAGAAAQPASLAAQLNGGQPSSVYFMAASFVGTHLGRFPAANCSPSLFQGLVGLQDFAETTPANAPAGFGSFDMTMSGACVTPFFQALLAHEPLTVIVTFFTQDGTPAITYSMHDAQLAHVSLSVADDAQHHYPLLEVTVSAPHVDAEAGGNASLGTSSSSGYDVSVNSALSSGTSSTSPSTGSASRSSARSTAPRARSIALSPQRMRALAVHLPASRLREVRPLRITRAAVGSAPPAAPSGRGSGWMGSSDGRGAQRPIYLNAQLAATAPQPLNANVNISGGLLLEASYAADPASQMPVGSAQVSLAPLQFATDAATMAALSNAARAHDALTHGVFVLSCTDGTPGITLTLHGGRFVSYQVAASASSKTLIVQTVQLGLAGFTITDVGSGKTAQTEP